MTSPTPLRPIPGEGPGRTDPHDLTAERATLGAMMLSEAAAAECHQIVTSSDFYRPAHQIIYEAITALGAAAEPADVVAVKAFLENAGTISKIRDATYLHTCIDAVPTSANGAFYARIVRRLAVIRRLQAAGRRIVQWAAEQGDDEHGLTERALREVEAVRDAGLEDPDTPTITEFLTVADGADEYDWIVPGLLERGDRMIITGTEGLGKSSLLRQLAVCIAAGLHPFTSQPITPQRVLFLDCENGPAHTRRKIRPLITSASLAGHPVPETNLWMEIRPEGMDLALERDVSRLLRLVAAITPDVVILGPLYRLAPRALNNDDDAAPVISALNMIRARGACVLLEAHAGHALGHGGIRDLRPRGSSAFLGWPEFGYGIRNSGHEEAKRRRLVDVVPWRGDRDEREWPEMLSAGGQWPWAAFVPSGQVVDPGPGWVG